MFFFCREGRRKWQKWQKRQRKRSNLLKSLAFFLAAQSGKRWQERSFMVAGNPEKPE